MKNKKLHPIVKHLLYGDIDEMSLSVLNEECPTQESYNMSDTEQCVRLAAAAATIQAWLEGKLYKGGYLFDS
jgi:hypothetical protein